MSMKLLDLAPSFVQWSEQPHTGDFVPAAFDTDTDAGNEAWKAAGYPTERRTELRERQTDVETLAEAHGVRATCPVCKTHGWAVTFTGRGVPDHLGSHNRDGKPSRWTVSGTGLGDMTLHPSVDLTGPKSPNCWHGWVKNGDVT